MDAGRLKVALAETIEPMLADLRRTAARKAEELRFGLSDGLFTRAQLPAATAVPARVEGELAGAEAVWRWLQRVLEAFATTEAAAEAEVLAQCRRSEAQAYAMVKERIERCAARRHTEDGQQPEV